nr:RNA-directed DNA polymerase, eukaryota [Tanacetum cinerariifolium]
CSGDGGEHLPSGLKVKRGGKMRYLVWAGKDIIGFKLDTIAELEKIDKAMDIRVVDDCTVLHRIELKNNLLKLTEMEAKDRIQKSKVKWAVEGDENSKFIHGITNKRRS